MVDKPFEIRFEWDDPTSAARGRAIALADDLTPAMKAVAVHLEGATRLRFETQRGPDGKPWKPSRRVIEQGGQTLSLSGDLKSSINSTFDSTSAEVGAERSFGSAVYAAIHQLGGTIRPRNKKALSFGGGIFAQVTMPARPYLGFGDSDREPILEIFTRFVAGLFGAGPATPGGEA
jgi:phage virion morphogenesis protein